jgi:polar amino acid transport system substrate-binding protein
MRRIGIAAILSDLPRLVHMGGLDDDGDGDHALTWPAQGRVVKLMENAFDLEAALGDLAPSGAVRAAVNIGNPVLARKGADGGEPQGVSVDIAREIGRRLGRPVRLIVFDTAGLAVDALARGEWDVAFLANEPARADRVTFSAPYVLIEGSYAVWKDAPFASTEEVDRDGVRVAVGLNAAYDLHLTRALKHAEIVRAPNSAAALELFHRDRLEAGAGVRQALQAFAADKPELRILPDAFMSIRQTVASPPGRAAGSAYLQSLVEELKASGWVRAALDRHGQQCVAVAP